MKTHARVVVIGGGVVGVSTLYHLAQKGWSDAVLLERSELTAGSTWHAAGLLPLFNMSYTVGQLHKYSVDLYTRLPAVFFVAFLVIYVFARHPKSGVTLGMAGRANTKAHVLFGGAGMIDGAAGADDLAFHVFGMNIRFHGSRET